LPTLRAFFKDAMDINAAMTSATADMINSIGMTITVGGVSKIALFDNEYIDISLTDGDVGSSSPAVHCKSSDVSAAVKGTAVVVSAINYTVAAPPKPDGTGMTVLVLKKS